MKDAFGNEVVRPAACPHPWCPPWKCMHPGTINEPSPFPSAEERRREMQETADKLRQAAEATTDPDRRDAFEQVVANLELIAQGKPVNPLRGKFAPPQQPPTKSKPSKKKKFPWSLL